MRNALIVAYDANKAVNYSDCYALTENSLFYVADKDCTNFVSQCVWAGYGGWVNGDETANAQNIAAHYRMYHHNNSDWYTTSWFAHKNGGSSPWESATSHGNFALGNTGSGLGPFGLGSTTAVLYSNYDASSIQRGDVVQLGRSANDIRHSVIVRTAGSSFENIFVNSHNSKHYNYPLSKYFETYSYIRVIHYRPAFFAN
ncbi:MAG: amidase domain-containing protein [Oscillibacter sp.]